jgi:hypothetical protein
VKKVARQHGRCLGRCAGPVAVVSAAA